ncbi:MAG: transcription termination/antitermination protein NusA [Chlamydiae bacterium]|nr:MAG: transcription termination/antitermination protein NusA [Chlamydiota bacterium]
MKNELLTMIELLEKDRSLDKGTVVSVVEQAIETAARRIDNIPPGVRVQVDTENGSIKAYSDVLVIPDDEEISEEDKSEESEVDLELTIPSWHLSKVLKYVPTAEAGQVIRIPLDIDSFGRISAQTAKQVILQRLRDAEREKILNEYSNKIGDLINGMVSRHERGNLVVDIERTEALLPRAEQSPSERYKPGDRLRAVVIDVRDTEEEHIPRVILSRATTGLVRRLFEIEVPEIYDGFVEIKNIAREAGYRTKVSVVSHDTKIDSVGACVGIRGSRVRNIVQELNGERIDIVRWSDSVEEYVTNALSPVELVQVFADPETERILVVVPDDQISLAIGKSGQNIRLTSKLLGWKVDVVKETEANRVASEHGVDITTKEKSESIFESTSNSVSKPSLTLKEGGSIFASDDEFEAVKAASKSKRLIEVSWLTANQIEAFESIGIKTVNDILTSEKETLLAVPGIGEKTLEKILTSAKADE